MKFEKIEKRGKFWFPSQSEAASGTQSEVASGTLTISDDGSIRLDIDELQLGPGLLVRDDPNRDQVIGQIELGQFAIFKDCVLINSKTPLNKSNTGLLSKCAFRSKYAFIGFPERPKNIPCFKTLKFSIEGIDQWVNISGVEHDYDYEKQVFGIKCKIPKIISFNINKNMEMRVEFGFNIDPSPELSQIKLVESVYFRLISSKPRDIEFFMSVAEKVRKLLCVVMNKPVSFDSVSAVPDLDYKDSARPVKIDIYGPGICASKMSVDINRMLFIFSNNQHDPNDPSVHLGSNAIKKWVGLYENYEVAFDLYFAAQTIRLLNAKFLLLAQGIEVFQRIKYKMSSNSNLMPGILDMLKESFITFDRKLQLVKDEETSKLAKALKNTDYNKNFGGTTELEKANYYLACYINDTRNYLTHYNRNKKPKAASGVGLYNLCLKLEMLLELHFLHLLGFSDEEIRRVLTKFSDKRDALLDIIK